MSDQLLWALLFGIGVFVAVVFISRQIGGDKAANKHNKRIINQLYEEQEERSRQDAADNRNILKADSGSAGRLLLSLPNGEAIYSLVFKAGLGNSVSGFLIACVGLFIALIVLLGKIFGGLYAFPIAIILTILLPRWYLKRKINKRNDAFINMFPDAVDMIVRSVKSGHPLNTALRMIAENMDPPVKTEFKQLVDEIAFGRSTVDALQRMAHRVDEPDLQFFVVILSVQQETGGNLAEVLSNLSGIVRKRKQLRLKIKAMTSEGRATAYILGALPFVVFGAIHVTSPDYLLPLFNDPLGQMILGGSLGLVALAAFIVYNMLQIDI
ncbi:MAG: type II secretion system F family protein [Alphaproteobacteria bacterium]|nr:type II secretion system F family protein [Alphaproteobacteria bacterium]